MEAAAVIEAHFAAMLGIEKAAMMLCGTCSLNSHSPENAHRAKDVKLEQTEKKEEIMEWHFTCMDGHT